MTYPFIHIHMHIYEYKFINIHIQIFLSKGFCLKRNVKTKTLSFSFSFLVAFAFEVFTNYHLDNAKLFFLLKAFLNFAEQMEPLILGSDFLVVYLPPHLPHQQSWLVLGNKGGLDYRKPQSCDSHLSRWYLLSLFCSASGQLGGQG